MGDILFFKNNMWKGVAIIQIVRELGAIFLQERVSVG